MQIDQNYLGDLEKDVALILERGSIPQLQDRLESEFESLLEDLPENDICIFKEQFLAIELFLKDALEPLTVESQNEFTGKFSDAVFMYEIYLNSYKSN